MYINNNHGVQLISHLEIFCANLGQVLEQPHYEGTTSLDMSHIYKTSLGTGYGTDSEKKMSIELHHWLQNNSFP